ncbi:MAG: NADH-quinone oxidoreductase subunit NuoH [Planctomycetes bacterium]|nr:NADH-quinone oxidoreductase subunit NuoH [Planctomycetota bacterium]
MLNPIVTGAALVAEAPAQGGNLTLDLLREHAPAALPGWSLPLITALISVVIVITVISLLAMVSVWLERKVSGHIQCRYGPMYAGGWHGWAQSIADGVKLLMKEDMIPLGSDKALFMLAPALVLGAIFGAFVAMPLAPDFYFADIHLGAFFILGMSSLTTIGVVMAGWASNSKWSLYGSMREAAQVVAYEIPLGLSLMVPLMVAGTFNLLDASAAQSDYWGMGWFVFKNPFVIPAGILFFVAALAETKRAPFDLPEAESELVAGFLTEYSGIRWSFFFMEEYAAMYLMSLMAAVFFLGGFESPVLHVARQAEWHPILCNLIAATTLIAKSMFGVLVMMWVRWTLPRVRIDQVMTMGYKYLTPLALLCALGAALWEAGKAWIFA